MAPGILTSAQYGGGWSISLPGDFILGEGAVTLGIKWPGVKLTTNRHPVSRLRMSGAMLEVPNTLSWSAQGKIYIYFLEFITALHQTVWCIGHFVEM